MKGILLLCFSFSFGHCRAADWRADALEQLYLRKPQNGVVQYRDAQAGPVTARVLLAQQLGAIRVAVTWVSDGLSCHGCGGGIGAIAFDASGKVLAADRWIVRAGNSGQPPEVWVHSIADRPWIMLREAYANTGETMERYTGLSLAGNHWRPMLRSPAISVYLDLVKCRGVCYDRVTDMGITTLNAVSPVLQVNLRDRATSALLGSAQYHWHAGRQRYEPFSGD